MLPKDGNPAAEIPDARAGRKFRRPVVRTSLVVRQTLWATLFLVAAIAIISLGAYFYVSNLLQAEVKQRLTGVAFARKTLLNEYAQHHEQQAALLAAGNSVQSLLMKLRDGQLSPSEIQGHILPALERAKRADDEILDLELADSRGTIVASTNPIELNQQVFDDEDFREGLIVPNLGMPFPAAGKFQAMASAPVRVDDQLLGVVLVKLDVTALEEMLADRTGLGPSGEVLVATVQNSRLHFIVGPRDYRGETQIDAAQFKSLAAAAHGDSGFVTTRDYRGQEVLAVFEPMGYRDWGLFVKVNAAEAFAPIAQLRRLLGTWAVAMLGVGVLVSYLLARKLTRPILAIADIAVEVAGGNLAARVEVDSDDELGALARAFNSMTVEVARSQVALRQRVADREMFLATLSHELRNPLSAIVAATQTLRLREREGDSAQVGRPAQIIQRQAQHMARMVDDLLDIARASQGKIELFRQPVDLRTVLDDAVESCRPLVQSREHRFYQSIEEAPLVVDGDPTRLVQVFVNLLKNAAKYTDPGGSIWLKALGEGHEAVVLLRDTGVGISPAEQPHVFDSYMQTDEARTRSQGGLGLGLMLVRRLVQMHGGSVAVFSEGLGRGSEFTVRLPLVKTPVAVAAVPRRNQPAPTSRRIVLVEDNADTRDMLRELLSLWGHEVTPADSGAAAITAVAQAIVAGVPPQVMLIDIGLPDMTGYDLAQRVQQLTGGEGISLVALTGHAQADDLRRAGDAGFASFLVKPVDLDELGAVLELAGSASMRQAGVAIGGNH